MTAVLPALADAPGALALPPSALKAARPVVGWAVLGAGFLLLQAWIFGSWIAAGDAHPIVARGPDHVQTATKIWAWMTQIGLSAVSIVVIVRAVLHWRRERKASFEILLCLAYFSVFWQDPGISYLQQGFLYNSYLVNLGSWAPHIPGWVSPNAGRLPEPLLLSGLGYFCMMFIFSSAVLAVLRRLHSWRPSWGRVRLALTIFAAALVIELAMDTLWIRSNLYAYAGSGRHLALWGGTRHQLPIMEMLTLAFVWTSTACLRYWVDDKGRTVVERGIDEVPGSARRKTLFRALALVGFANTMYLIYNLGLIGISPHSEPFPAHYPSYLTNGICGPGTAYICPGS